MGRSKKLEVRRALRRGIAIREGTRADVPQFFKLMSATCARQGVQPNPASEAGLGHLVRIFDEAGAARLSLAEVEGEPVACVLDLRFGKRVTAWKKGWNGSHPDRYPNTMLAYESLRRAADQGCLQFDFAGMGRSLAEHLLAGGALTEEQKKDRDVFNLELGAQPQLLPPALILWRSPPLRFLYQQAVARPWLATRLRRAVKRMGSA